MKVKDVQDLDENWPAQGSLYGRIGASRSSHLRYVIVHFMMDGRMDGRTDERTYFLPAYTPKSALDVSIDFNAK